MIVAKVIATGFDPEGSWVVFDRQVAVNRGDVVEINVIPDQQDALIKRLEAAAVGTSVETHVADLCEYLRRNR